MKIAIKHLAFLLFICFALSCGKDDDPVPVAKYFYVVGASINYDEVLVATIWKNGGEIPLTDGSNDSEVNSIYAVKDDVYMAGFEIIGSTTVAKFWKNGVATSLTDGSNAHRLNQYSFREMIFM